MRTTRLLVALLAALSFVVLVPATAQACSCLGGTAKDFLGWSDTAFTGTLTGVDLPPERRVMSSTDRVTYTFEVDTVYEGSVAPTQDVVSVLEGASCGLEWMDPGLRYVVYASTEGGELHASLCSGTTTLTPRLAADLRDVAGAGRPVTADPPSPGPAPGEQVIAAGPGVVEVASTDARSTWWMWATGALILLAAAATGPLVLRRRR